MIVVATALLLLVLCLTASSGMTVDNRLDHGLLSPYLSYVKTASSREQVAVPKRLLKVAAWSSNFRNSLKGKCEVECIQCVKVVSSKRRKVGRRQCQEVVVWVP